MKSRALICVVGPTAAGKSEIAQQLALLIQGEIVSADSMQIYRCLDIGTAKPSVEERKRVPHHLVDIVELTEPSDAAAWLRKAQEAVKDIRRRNRLPILCGGTGLYFKAYLEGLGVAPASDSRIRHELERTPLAELVLELKRVDPIMFERIDRKNPRRVIRAVEVVRLSGRSYNAQRAPWHGGRSKDRAETQDQSGSVVFFGIERERRDLRRRIEERVQKMFESGLVEETRGLLDRGLEKNRTAMQAIGYRQVVEYFHGERTLPDTIALIRQRTWQLARRQMSWFRHQANVDWVMVKADESAAAVAERLSEKVGLVT